MISFGRFFAASDFFVSTMSETRISLGIMHAALQPLASLILSLLALLTSLPGSRAGCSRIYALLRSYRYSVASAASQPLLFLVVALACIVPAAGAECRQVDGCGDCNDKNCGGGEYYVCRSKTLCAGLKKE